MTSKAKLIDLTLKIGSGATPRGGKSAYLDKGEYKLIRSQNIYNHFFSKDGLAYISEEQAKKLNNVELHKGDILINITGDSVARTAMVQDDMLPGRVNQHVSIIRCDVEKLYPHFLLAVLTSDIMQRKLLSLAQVGGTRAALTKGMLEGLEIDVFSLKKQKYIGDILKSINCKIENNENIIQTLEETSQTIFKRWFIDFEFPNEECLPYKSSGGKMVESELGEIPEAWKVGTIKDICSMSSEKINLEKTECIYDYIGLEHMPQGNIALGEWESSEKVSGIKGLFKKGDILFGKLRPYFKKVGITAIEGVCSTDILVFRPKKDFEKAYLLMNLVQDKFIEYTTSTATGTRMPRTGWNQISRYSIVIPPNNLLTKLNDVVSPMLVQIQESIHENISLEELRDSLLPKLLSGEIEIPVESVVD